MVAIVIQESLNFLYTHRFEHCKQILTDDLVVMSVKISLMFAQWPKIGPFV